LNVERCGPPRDLVAVATALLPEIRAQVDAIERGRRLPADLARRFAGAGLFRSLLPVSLGGMELDPRTALASMETIGQADASAGWCVMIGATAGMAAAWLPPDAARTVHATPTTITGGVFAPMGRAVREGDGYRLTGRWQWMSGNANCDWLMGGALIVENGEPRRLPSGAPESRMLFFPAAAATRIDSWHAAGLSGTGSGEVEVSDLFVPHTHTISLVGETPREPGPLYRFPPFGLLALGIAAVMMGNARAAIDDLVELAGSKRPQGSTRMLAERAGAQAELAQAEARLRSARAWYYESVDHAWERARAGQLLEVADRAELRLAATWATRTCAEVTRSMYDLGGGSSVFLSSPLQRRFRDAHVGTQHMMVSAATYELAGRVLMGVPTDASLI